MKMFRLVSLFVFFSFHSAAFGEGGGLNLTLNHIELRLEYNDNTEVDNISGMKYIREPSGALFDLISIFQKNRTEISPISQHIHIDTDNYNKALSIYLRKKPKGYLVDLRNISKIDKNIIISGVCKALKISNCKVPDKKDTINLFISNSHLSNKSSDLIEFGCFPCRNDRSIALSNRYEPEKPNPYPPAFKKVTVNKETIYHYFNKLRD